MSEELVPGQVPGARCCNGRLLIGREAHGDLSASSGRRHVLQKGVESRFIGLTSAGPELSERSRPGLWKLERGGALRRDAPREPEVELRAQWSYQAGLTRFMYSRDLNGLMRLRAASMVMEAATLVHQMYMARR